MRKYYEVIGKDFTVDGWETLKETKTINQAISYIKKNVNVDKYTDDNNEVWLDINLIVNDDLIETYDINGKVR